MTWHVQYRAEGVEQVSRYLTPEAAIEGACGMIDAGREVFGIGTGELTNSIEREEILRIHGMLARAGRVAAGD